MYNLKIKSVKGMKDYTPKDLLIYQYLEKSFKKIINNYCFNEVRFPILEYSSLFEKNFYYKNNIFLKNMYSFYDKNNNQLSLRPEGTIGCARMYIEQKLFIESILQKFWYLGPMFRYENTQKARYRQFYQIGLEIFGCKDICSNLELILIINRFFKLLGINDLLVLEINCIGNIKDRIKYLKHINSILKYNNYIVNDKKFNKVDFNIFRMFDSNNINYSSFLNSIPKITDYLNAKSLLNFNLLCNELNKLNISFKINKNLVRGLDYYNDFVFEWKYKLWKTRNTICAGGRYDYLIQNISNMVIPAVGLGVGLDRLFLIFKENNNLLLTSKNKIDIYIISSFNKETKILGISIIDKILNSDLYFLKIYNNYVKCKKLGDLIIKVIKLNVRILIIIDKKEIENNIITIKDLYLNNQITISKRNSIVKAISNILDIKY